MYSKYDFPFQIDQDDLPVSIEERGQKSYHDSRIYRKGPVEKSLVLSKAEVLAHPVEPHS